MPFLLSRGDVGHRKLSVNTSDTATRARPRNKKMVVSRTLSAAVCASCRVSILRNFISFSGISHRTLPAPPRLSRYGRPSEQFRLSSQLARDGSDFETARHESIEEAPIEEEVVEEDLLEEDTEDRELDASSQETQVSAVPWYLQVESPHRAPKPLSERQKLPELPESSPPILEPLMQQISVDLGLDNLTLLDLRKIDPPPALGANLLMLIGTARSEKHLHVSADRLCRWLRSNYKLRPDADGLLGRNELKLKLKRKAKRAKLMGSAKDDAADDGVRTGWVCVDMGVVENAEGVVDDAPRNDNFVGFGRRTEGVRIVVQMLTEEKREDIELEQLWSGILRRATNPEIEDVAPELLEGSAQQA